jgi:hypothetical protein
MTPLPPVAVSPGASSAAAFKRGGHLPISRSASTMRGLPGPARSIATGMPGRSSTDFNVVEVCLQLSYFVKICQLTATDAVFMITAIMERHDVYSHSRDIPHPAVAAAPASRPSRPGCAGGPRRLDDLRLRTRRGRYPHLPALLPRPGLAGDVERPGHVDRPCHTIRRRAARLNRLAPRPRQSWPGMPLMRPLWPGLVWVWRGLLVGTPVPLARHWPDLQRGVGDGRAAVCAACARVRRIRARFRTRHAGGLLERVLQAIHMTPGCARPDSAGIKALPSSLRSYSIPCGSLAVQNG